MARSSNKLGGHSSSHNGIEETLQVALQWARLPAPKEERKRALALWLNNVEEIFK